MVFWAVAATLAAVSFAVLWGLYRRQVKKINQQMDFLQRHQTNLRLTSDLPFPEANQLIDGINQIIDRSREIQQQAQQNETNLKDTITNLSHDIRTPLTSLDGYFQLLLQSDSEQERQRYISIIQTRIDSLKDMLEELFTYTKLQNTSYQLPMEPVDFSKCVYDTVFSFYRDFQEKGISPRTEFCNGHFYIAGNEEALHRAIQNLIKNALEHSHTQISLELFYRENQVGFRCSNDVKHPEEIDIHQVFHRFYKADPARTHSSTGLGLSIAQGLTEQMGGTISASLEQNLFAVQIQFAVERITGKRNENEAVDR